MTNHENLQASLLERLFVAEDVLRDSSDHIALQQSSVDSHVASWRENITQWFYDVVDNTDEPRSVVYVALNILDRYNAVKRSNFSMDSNHSAYKQLYRVAAMTAIFLSVRVSGNGSLQITDVIQANGEVGVEDIIAMGREMRNCLTWGIRLVTPHEFIVTMTSLLPESLSTTAKKSICNSACYLAELAVFDTDLSKLQTSKVAMAALLNSLEGLVTDSELTDKQLSTFREALRIASCTRTSTVEIVSIQARLRNIFDCVETDSVILPNCPNYVSDAEGDDDECENDGELRRESNSLGVETRCAHNAGDVVSSTQGANEELPINMKHSTNATEAGKRNQLTKSSSNAYPPRKKQKRHVHI